MNDNFHESVTIGGAKVYVFASHTDITHRDYWSITVGSDNTEIAFKSMDEHSLAQLKQLRKSIDGAIKFLDGVKITNNDVKGKKNDGKQKKHVD